MGPYCNFCNDRCFVPMPDKTPAELRNLYRPSITIIATCKAGQEYERQGVGTCYSEIMERISQIAAEKASRQPKFLEQLDEDLYQQRAPGKPSYW